MVQVLLPASELSSITSESDIIILLHTSESEILSILLLSPHNNHISRFFSTQIITFPGFIPSKTIISAFIQQERSPKPAENSIFHICQKITYFDIFHLFHHFKRSSKFTHFHKNTKNTIFHYFSIRWRFCDFSHFPQIPKNAKNEDFLKIGQNGEFLENGQNQENGENGENGQIPKKPKNGQNAKNGENGDFAHIPPKWVFCDCD